MCVCVCVCVCVPTKSQNQFALMICFKTNLTDELKFIKKASLKNGYPEDVITYIIKYRCLQFSTKLKFGPGRCPIYLRLPWIDNASMQLIEQVKNL